MQCISYPVPTLCFLTLPSLGHEADNHDDAELFFHRDELQREREQAAAQHAEASLPLNDAAAAGNLARVQALVRKYPLTVNSKDNNGWQPIHEGTVRYAWNRKERGGG
jgi:hypothetical protein